MSWLKSVSVGLKIVFGRRPVVSPTISVEADEIARLLKLCRMEFEHESRGSGDRTGAEDDQNKGGQDAKEG